MAYREFSNEKLTESPNLGDLPNTLQALSFVNQQKSLQQQRQYNAVQDIKNFAITNKIPKYVQGLTEMTKEFANRRVNEIYQHGQLSPSPQMTNLYTEGTNLNAQANAIQDAVKEGQEKVMAINDPYYRREHDLKKFDKVIENRGDYQFGQDLIAKDEALTAEARNSIYSPEEVLENFNLGKARSDWIKLYADKSKEVSVKSVGGAKEKSLITAPFVNPAGISDVTNDHISDLFLAHKMIKTAYNHLAMDMIRSEIDENIAADPSYLNKIGAQNKEQAFVAILQNPELNPNSKSWGEARDAEDKIIPNKKLQVADRIRELARKDIKREAKYITQWDADYSDVSPSSEAGFTSKDASSTEIFDANNSVSGPGRTISRTKPATHPYYKIPASRSPMRMDLDTGEIIRDNLPKEFTLNSMQLVTVDASGKIIGFNAKNADDLEKQIDDASLSKFGDKGITGTKIAFRGQTIDKSAMEEAIKKRDELEALWNSDKTNTAVKDKLDFLQVQIEKAQYGEPFNMKFIEDLTGKKALHNEIFTVEPGDVNVGFMKDQLGGDVYSQKAETPQMQRIKAKVDRKVKEANATLKERTSQDLLQNKQEPKQSYKFTTGINSGREYSVETLKKEGYTDDEIKQAIKQGILK